MKTYTDSQCEALALDASAQLGGTLAFWYASTYRGRGATHQKLDFAVRHADGRECWYKIELGTVE